MGILYLPNSERKRSIQKLLNESQFNYNLKKKNKIIKELHVVDGEGFFNHSNDEIRMFLQC